MPIIFTLLVCVLVNILRGSSAIITLSNLIILFLSMELIKTWLAKKNFPWLIVFIGFIPLLSYNRGDIVITLIIVLSLALMVVFQKILLLKPLIIVPILLLFFGNLTMNNLVNLRIGGGPTSVDFAEERLVYFRSGNTFQEIINNHKVEFILPHRINNLFYNKLIYIPFTVGNLLRFLSLRNIYDVILFVNLIPLVVGLYFYYRDFRNQDKIIILWIMATLIPISISNSVDKFNSLYLASPLLIYFIVLGMQKIKMRYYLPLLFISLFI